MSAEKSKYLEILSIAHYVVGALAFLFGCFPILHLVFGFAFLTDGLGSRGNSAAPAMIGCAFISMALLFIATAWTYGYFMIVAGKSLVARERHMLCLVMAGVSCMFAPIGTVLGIFTLIVLLDEQVKAEFGEPSAT